MPEHSNLPAALAAFQAEMPRVGKTKTANTGSYSYSYADLADVTAAAMPLLAKHGLSFSACPRINDKGSYELAAYLMHTSNPDNRLEGALPLHGNNPQQLGGAITYARRYLLGCMTGIVTDDDTDAQGTNDAPPTQPAPPPYTGPSTVDMLNRIDEMARDHDDDYGTVLAPFLKARGITLNDLDRHPASDLKGFYDHVVKTYATKDGTA